MTDPYERFPQPSSLAPDVYFAMPLRKRLEFTKQQLTTIQQRRRAYLETGITPGDRFGSSYEELIKIINDEPIASGSPAGTATPEQFGAVLAAARQRGELGATSASASWEAAVKLAKIVGRMAPPEAVAARNQAIMRMGGGTDASRQTRQKSVAAAMHGSQTLALADRLQKTQTSAGKIKHQRDRFEDAAEPVRQMLLRRASFPIAPSTLRGMLDERQKLKQGIRDAQHLSSIIEGLEPRPAEAALAKQVQELKRQVNNQVALIKGLREKLKVVILERDALLEYCRNAASAPEPVGSEYPLDESALSPLMRSSSRRFRASAQQSFLLASPSLIAAARGSEPLEQGGDRQAAGPTLSRARSRLFASVAGSSITRRRQSIVTSVDAAEADDDADTPNAQATKKNSFVLSLIHPSRAAVAERGTPPLSGNATIVVIDIQSNAHLWETMPGIMARESSVFMSVVQAKRAQHDGYLVDRVGERLCLAFAGPYGAVRFALDLQVALCSAPWCAEICENPDTPTELAPGSATQHLWRGLRVSVGVATGATPLLDPLSQQTIYTGAAVQIAGFLQLLAAGGEVLCTEEVQSACGALVTQGVAVSEAFGKLATHPSRVTVFRLVARQHNARLHFFKRDHRVAEEGAMDAARDVRSLLPTQHVALLPPIHHSAPIGTVALLSLSPADLAELRALQELPDKVLNAALAQYRRVVEALAKTNRGYICRFYDYCYDMAFQQSYDAVQMAIRLQTSLLEIPWSDELLSVPRCASIKLGMDVLFSGLRVRAGIHVVDNATPEIDLMSGTAHYVSHREGLIASAGAAIAQGGETLITQRLVDVVSKNIDRLRFPVYASAVGVNVPGFDGVQTFSYMYPAALAERASFLRREMRLASEPADDRTEAIDIAERNVAVLRAKLIEKEVAVQNLERHTLEKTEVIQQLREQVIGRPFIDIDVRSELASLESGGHYDPVIVVALSFAHVASLIDMWPDELPEAVSIFDEFTETLLTHFGGTELRRTQSGSVRIVSFSDIVSAVEFWLTIVRNASLLPWPERLLQSEHAGVVMASDISPGLHPALDTVYWKGLRPIAGMVRGIPDTTLNPVTRSMVVAGGCVNEAILLMRHAGDGEMWLSEQFASETVNVTRDRISNMSAELITDAGVYRIFPSELARRHHDVNRVITRLASESCLPVSIKTESRRIDAFVVHIVRQRIPFFKNSPTFVDDLERFNVTLRDLLTQTDAKLISSSDTEYLLGFMNAEQGADFALRIHSALLRQRWSAPLLQFAEHRQRWSVNGLCLAGLRATCGCHFMEDIALTTDLVEGSDMWVHRELVVPFLLTRDATPGLSVCTNQALQLVNKVRRFAAYSEVCGSVVMPTGTVPSLTYICLPSPLKDRVVLLAQDSKNRLANWSTPRARDDERRWEKAAALAESILRDREAYASMPVSHGAPSDSASRALQALRKRLVKAYGQRATVEDTMSILETTAMMAEDTYYATESMKAAHDVPQFQALLFHHLEHCDVGKRALFNRELSNDLLFRYALAPTPDERDASTENHGDAEERQLSSSLNVDARVIQEAHSVVERFVNLITMFGVHQGKGIEGNRELLKSWMGSLFEAVCSVATPATASDGDLEQRLREMARRTRAWSEMESSADSETLRRSVIANLSLAFQRLIFHDD